MKKKEIEKALNNRNLKIVLCVLVFLMGIVLLLFNYMPNKKVTKKNNQKEVFAHTEDGITKEVIVEGVKFTNISMITKNKQTIFSASVVNTTENDIKREKYSIDLLNKKGIKIITLIASVPNGLKKGEVKTITAVSSGYYRNAFSKVIH